MEIESRGNLSTPRKNSTAMRARIESLKRQAVQSIIPTPIAWLDEDVNRNMLMTTVDAVINWARRSSLWPVICFPRLLRLRVHGRRPSRFDLSRFGMEILRASPRQADLMITAGTLTWKMAPQVRRIYDQMPEPKWVIAMGACGISGGIFRSSYNVVPGYNKIVPVDVYVPGCPPRPEALIYGIQLLQKKICASAPRSPSPTCSLRAAANGQVPPGQKVTDDGQLLPTRREAGSQLAARFPGAVAEVTDSAVVLKTSSLLRCRRVPQEQPRPEVRLPELHHRRRLLQLFRGRLPADLAGAQPLRGSQDPLLRAG